MSWVLIHVVLLYRATLGRLLGGHCRRDRPEEVREPGTHGGMERLEHPLTLPPGSDIPPGNGSGAPYPARAGGPWLCSTLVLSLFQAVVVPSGLSTRVQPHR